MVDAHRWYKRAWRLHHNLTCDDDDKRCVPLFSSTILFYPLNLTTLNNRSIRYGYLTFHSLCWAMIKVRNPCVENFHSVGLNSDARLGTNSTVYLVGGRMVPNSSCSVLSVSLSFGYVQPVFWLPPPTRTSSLGPFSPSYGTCESYSYLPLLLFHVSRPVLYF